MRRYIKIDEKKVKKAHAVNYVEAVLTLDDWPQVKGYDFEKGLDFQHYLDSLFSTGFQATELAKAIDIVRQMRKTKAVIFLGYTSNMVSCGVREVIAYLVKHKLVDVLVTTAGGVEEDIIKALKPFVIGNYDAPGGALRDKGINRTGNTFIPNDRYLYFERLMMPFLERMLALQKQHGRAMASREFVHELGKTVKDEHSILYWATRNDIPLFCPALTDGSIGDMVYFFKQQHPEFLLDITDDIVEITNLAINAKRTGIIALGGSLPKHMIANANLFRDGADYAIYLTTAMEYEGSNAGANIQEAMSWGNRPDAPNAKVVGDASITFPLLVAGGFVDRQQQTPKQKSKARKGTKGKRTDVKYNS
ncbi:MAG: deoxyhypusine synthase [DPANN group archaeon]|nr:deoxyhypusine synthase [DPANN group archaeon]